ncbi:hypothetical protein KAI78_02070 [bacterium]|nr:hypothetical protein [bacterium]
MDFRDAHVQYGDFHGRIAIDGFFGPFIHNIAEMINIPSNYFPIGFSIQCGERPKTGDKVFLDIAAVDKNLYGESVDEIQKRVENGIVNAKVFQGEILLEDFFSQAKRTNLTGVLKALDDLSIEVDENY